MRIFSSLLLLAIGSSAFAQTDGSQQKMQRIKSELENRFNAADANHDGKLTIDEANGKMPRVYKNFAAIDSQQNGYVTIEQVEQFAASKFSARKAK
jgi:Ca2+-binding EF-hand superfamily protein